MSRPVWPVGHYVSGLSVCHTLRVPQCMQHPANYRACSVQQIIVHVASSKLSCMQRPANYRACSVQQIIVHAASSKLSCIAASSKLSCMQHPANYRACSVQQIIVHAASSKLSCMQRPANYHACSVQQIFFLSCMHCNANMTLMWTSYFVLTLTSIQPAPEVAFNFDFNFVNPH